MDKFGVVRQDITPATSNPAADKTVRRTEAEALDYDLIRQVSKSAEELLRDNPPSEQPTR